MAVYRLETEAPRVAQDDIGAVVAVQHILPAAADEDVVAVTTVDGVVAVQI